MTLTGSGFATEFTFRSPGGGEDMGSSRVALQPAHGRRVRRDDDDMVGDDMAHRRRAGGGALLGRPGVRGDRWRAASGCAA